MEKKFKQEIQTPFASLAGRPRPRKLPAAGDCRGFAGTQRDVRVLEARQIAGAPWWRIQILTPHCQAGEGVDWVAAEAQKYGKPVIANMSLGGSGSKTGTCTASGFSGSDSYHQSICNATRSGVVFAVAAGNDGADAAGAVPAAYDDAVVTVSATSSSDNWPSWSNWGDDAASWTVKLSAPVAIAAPGVSILSTRTGGGTTTMSGTSMASPHVAGALALLLKSNPQSANYSAFANLRAMLLSTAESTVGFSNTSGKPHDEDFLDVRGY